MNCNNYVSKSILADILSVSKTIIEKWEASGKIKTLSNGKFDIKNLSHFKQISDILNSKWNEEQFIRPNRKYKSIELFAGTGGLAIGLEQAGFDAVALNEIDKDSCKTLTTNRPNWNVIKGDIKDVDFSIFKDIDLISGGFPCQAFSYAGKKMGFEDARGTLFFEFSRAIKEVKPKIFLGENVKGLFSHDGGRTLETIKSIIHELGYILVEPKILKAIFYRVPQKRERLFLVGIRKDLFNDNINFSYPSPYNRVMTVRDALKKGGLYNSDCPKSEGQAYPKRKAEIFSLVPAGGNWVNLPDDMQREYMQKSYFMGGGKTGMARRLSFDEPSLTLTCSPAQKQTERCHPEETRPLTVREYARIQTFPDNWQFVGSVSSKYKQIGNAVPVNLAYAVGNKLVYLLNTIEENNYFEDIQYRYNQGNYIPKSTNPTPTPKNPNQNSQPHPSHQR